MTIDSPKFGRDVFPLTFDGVSTGAPLSAPPAEPAPLTAGVTNTLSMYKETRLAGSAEASARANCDPVQVAIFGVASAVIARYPKVPDPRDESPIAKALTEEVQGYTSGRAEFLGLDQQQVYDAIHEMRSATLKTITPVE